MIVFNNAVTSYVSLHNAIKSEIGKGSPNKPSGDDFFKGGVVFEGDVLTMNPSGQSNFNITLAGVPLFHKEYFSFSEGMVVDFVIPSTDDVELALDVPLDLIITSAENKTDSYKITVQKAIRTRKERVYS